MSSQKLAETQTPPEQVEGLDYDEAIANIARLRDRLLSAESSKKLAEIEFQESNDYRAWQAAGEALDAAEEELRTKAVADFARTADKKPHAGIHIKIFTNFSVTSYADALKYCRESLPQVLVKPVIPETTYSTSAFKKIILALDDSARPDCVRISTEPRAEIASDLTEYAKKPEDDHGE